MAMAPRFPNAPRRLWGHGLGALALCLGLTTCGGGALPQPQTVTLHLQSPEAVEACAPEGAALPGVTFRVIATGSISSLAGKSIFIRVDQPEALFEATPSFYQKAGTADTYDLVLMGRGGLARGAHSGSLAIHVSTDPAGLQPLGGSPMVVPYTVQITAAEPGP